MSQSPLVRGPNTGTSANYTTSFSQLAPPALQCWADDGQLPPDVGQAGSVITWHQHNRDALLAALPPQVLVCGPNPMMAAVVAWWAEVAPQVPVWVSLENHMPCGTGACWGCVVGQAPSPQVAAPAPIRVCHDGPVLLASRLAWQASGPCSTGWYS
jgi:NAD(P)H-flavin reductase